MKEEKTVLYGTTNPAKLASMQSMLAALPIRLISLADVRVSCDIDESGNQPAQNARIKAWAYFRATGLVTFSQDSGLMLEGLPEQQQPGVHVRRVRGETLDDDGMIREYTRIAREAGGRIAAHYAHAVHLVKGPEADFAFAYVSQEFWIVDTPHERRNPGFPLDSISVDMKSGQFYYDLPAGSLNKLALAEEGLQNFFRGALGLESDGYGR